MSELNENKLKAIADAYTTLRATYEVFKNTERSELAVVAAESMAALTDNFPQIAELENAISEVRR